MAAFVLGLVAAHATPAGAGPRGVVELFTSQGCSSCPPADRMMAELVRDPDLVGLSFAVDYWDYLGWKDTNAKPEFSARQRAYATVRRDGQVFTPQVIVNGVASRLGSDRSGIDRAIAASPAGRGSLPVPLSLGESGSRITVEVGAATGPARAADVWLLPIAKHREVAIGRGENRGRTVAYTNVVRGMTKIGTWTGDAARFEAARPEPKGDADSYVVLLQASGPGAILGAAKAPGG